MDLTVLKNNFDLVSYVSALVKLTKHGKYYSGACPMCGGRDRFTIKRTTRDIWICRKCSDGKYHSAVDFIMAYHSIDLQEALQRMCHGLQQSNQMPQRRSLAAPIPVHELPSRHWQSDAWHQIDTANDRLFNNKTGEAGSRYLFERGISRGAMYMWLLGYGVVYGRPAIYIPYLDTSDVVLAIKFRFIDGHAQNDKAARYAMKKGSQPYLFGLQHVQQSDHTLLFVEGELNAISILQALPRGVSAVSMGSESNGYAAILHAIARRYERVVVWMDDPIKAITTRNRIGRDTETIKSPIIGENKWDANEMLKSGLLIDFLTEKLRVKCLGVPIATSK